MFRLKLRSLTWRQSMPYGVRGKEKLTLKQAQRHAIYQIVKSALSAMIKHRE